MLNVSIQSRIDRDNLAKLKRIAGQKGLSISLMVRFIILQYLEGNDNE